MISTVSIKSLWQSLFQLTIAILMCFASVSVNIAQATPTPVIPLPSPAPTYDIQVKARWGATGYESAMFTPGNPSPTGVTLNPSGTPAWSVGNYHPFSFTYSAFTGITTWSIDFNRDGDFLDSEESKSSTSSTLIGYQFKYLNLWMSGSSTAPNTVDVRNFTVNGTNLGSFTSNASTTPIEWSWTDDSGWFQEVVLTGEYRMSASSSSQETNRMWIRLGEKQLITYTVSYNGNSNTGGTAPSNQTKDYGVNLALANNSGNLVRTGYTFNGWNTQADGLGIDYAVGSNYTTNAALTLYAKWTPLPNRTVTFNANGGTGSMAPQTTNVPTALTTNTFTRVGYTFSGWNTAANGSGTAYAGGATYNFTVDVTLYAQWVLIPLPPPLPPPPDFAQKQINEAQVQLAAPSIAADVKVVPTGASASAQKTYDVALAVQNVSPVAAPAVLASLNLPSDLNVVSVKWEKEGQYYVDGNLPRTCSFDGRTAYCGIGQLWSGMKATITLRVTADPKTYPLGIKAEDLSTLYEVTTKNQATIFLNLN